MTKQRLILWGSCVLLVLIALFPPWRSDIPQLARSVEYRFLYAVDLSRDMLGLDVKRLVLQLGALIAVTLICLYFVSGAKAQRKKILAACLVALTLYAATYVVLSRRGLRRDVETGLAGFRMVDYVRYLGRDEKRFERGARMEAALCCFFYPAHVVDQYFFDGPPWGLVTGPM